MVKKIAVHNGSFHCDDALAIYLLLQTDDFKGSEIERTRDDEIINSCQAAVDVGGVYDHSKFRYDHHQNTFHDKFPNSDIPMASCGLIYLHFGQEVIRKKLSELKIEVDDSDFDFLYRYMYFTFVQEIDAIDSGVSQINDDKVYPNYKNMTSLANRVAILNPQWKENYAPQAEDFNKAFLKAVELTGKEFDFFLTYAAKCSIRQLKIVKEEYQKRNDLDPSGRIISLPEYFPIIDYLKEIENGNPSIYFIICPNRNNEWEVRTVFYNSSFLVMKKLALPGVEPTEMKNNAGIDGLIFSDKRGNVAVFQNREQALAYAKYSLEN